MKKIFLALTFFSFFLQAQSQATYDPRLARSSTDNAVVRYDGTNGKQQNSGTTIDDNGAMTIGGTSSQIALGNGYLINGDDSLKLKIFSTGYEDWLIDAESTTDTIVHSSGSGATTHLFSGLGLKVSSTSTSNQLTLESTNSTSSNEAVFKMIHDRGTGSAGEQIAILDFYGRDSASNLQRFAFMFIDAPTVTDGAENGRLTLNTIVSGTSREHLKLDSTGVTVHASDLLTTGPITASGIITANAGVLAANGATSAGFVDIYEDSDNGSNKTRLIAGSQSADITYTLPTTIGAAGTVLRDVAGNGVLDWGTAGAAPGGSGTEIQYRGGASTLSAVSGSSVSGSVVTLGSLVTTTAGVSSYVDGLIINSDSSGTANDDFIAKGDTDSNTLYVDASADSVGIGTATPARKLHIVDAMRLEPRASAPSTAASGDIYIDSTPSPDELCFYDGTGWQGISSGTDANCA